MNFKVRHYVYTNPAAFAELRMARLCWSASRAAKTFEANPALVHLYRSWMSHHAYMAIRHAKMAQADKVA